MVHAYACMEHRTYSHMHACVTLCAYRQTKQLEPPFVRVKLYASWFCLLCVKQEARLKLSNSHILAFSQSASPLGPSRDLIEICPVPHGRGSSEQDGPRRIFPALRRAFIIKLLLYSVY